MALKHAKTATLPDQAGVEINKGEWNADHLVDAGGITFSDATVQTTAATGNVSGPASSTANAIARYSGITGKIIQDYTSNAPTITDTGQTFIGPASIPTIGTSFNSYTTDLNTNVVINSLQASGVLNAAGNTQGLNFGVTDSGTNNVTSITGINGLSIKSGSGLATTMNGANAGVRLSGSSTAGTMNGYTGQIRVQAGTSATTAVMYNAPSPTLISTGTIANAYGSKVAAQKVTNVTTGYGFASDGASDLNYMAGKLRVGSSVDPVEVLDVTGNITASGTITGINLSGTNTGDQTNIAGNAATVSSINGLVTAGGNISLVGSGNTASAYSISAIDNNPKNRIIDGAFNVDQIWQNNLQTIAAGSYMTDQWKYQATQASKITSQVTAGAIANGFPNNLSIAVLATATIGASDYFVIQQPIEGCNITDFKFGTTAASAVSLQFNINTSQTGTWSGSLGNSAGNRSYPFTFSVPSANVTTNIQIQNIPGDQSGTWLNSPNMIGVNLNICLGAGSTFVGTSGTWAASNLYGATGTVNLLSTIAATAKITAVQLEVGSFCTNYETKSYPYELWQCSRHYTLVNQMISSINGTGAVQAHFAVPAPMMKIPTVSFIGTASIGIPGVATYTSTAQPSSNVDNPYNSIIQLNQTGFNTGAVSSGFGFLFQASYYRVAAQL